MEIQNKYSPKRCVNLTFIGVIYSPHFAGHFYEIHMRKKPKRSSISNLHNIYLQKYYEYLRSAKTRELDFDLSPNQFMALWRADCVYCGEKIDTIGIDRIDNSYGYTIDNVIPCCTNCNKMKMGQDLENFIIKCGDIYFNFNKKKIKEWHDRLILGKIFIDLEAG